MSDITKWAAPSTDISHNHEGCGPTAKTLRQVRTSRFFANRM